MRLHPAYPTTRHRTGAVLAVGLVMGAALSGCEVAKPPPEPNDAAKALADGLASADLGKVSFDGATADSATNFVRTAVGELKDVKRTVTVSKVVKTAGNEKKATATLVFTWDVSDAPQDWIYTSDADLSLAADKTWHVTWSPSLFAPDLTAYERLAFARTVPKRADIVGAGGTPLMSERDVFQVGIDKGRIPPAQAGASATALAQLLGIDAAAYARQVTAAAPQAFVLALAVRTDDPLLGKASAAAIGAIPGGVRVPAKGILAPSATFARALLGTVGPATADLVQKSQGTLTANDTVGLSGLEQRYDAQLRGQRGFKVQAVGTDPAGKATGRDLFSQEPVPGKPLVLSLDAPTQQAAEAALAGQTTVSAALVAIRASTGEILAAANGPATNGNAVATTGHAAPGSTFKIATSLALVRAGFTPDSPVDCAPTVVVDGRTFKNYDDYPLDRIGQIPLRAAVANSCNTAFISNSSKVSQADLAAAANALGIGVDADLGFPAFLGSVPAQAASKTEHAASMIGQGKVDASPMSMATAVASVLKGALVQPKLIADNAAALPPPAKPLQPGEAAALRDLLGAVVTDGSGRLLADAGATLAKTGTAEYGNAKPLRTHAWMVAGRGDLAVAVYVEDGAGGSKTAGPLLKAFLQSIP